MQFGFIDMLKYKNTDIPVPKYLKISGYDISKAPEYLGNTRKNIPTKSGSIVTIGSLREFTLPLYIKDEKPLWEQPRGNERTNLDLEAIHIKIPNTDVVRLEIQLPEEIAALWALDSRHLEYNEKPKMWDNIYIMGFPHGYSATTKNSPTPIAIRRMIASWTTERTDKTLLDGACVAGMSGGPVYSKQKKLVGIYQGIIFPDYSPEKNVQNDRHSALGIMTEYYMIGLMFGDLDLDENFKFKFQN